MLFVTGETLFLLQEIGDVDRFTVDSGADKALTRQFSEKRVVLALTATHDRCQHLEPNSIVEAHDAIDDLLGSLSLEAGAVVRAVLLTNARVQETQIVVHLGNRSDRASGVTRGRLLVDRNSRREAVDVIDIRLVHLAEELTRVCRQALDVPTLALGVDGVESQARLSRTRKPCEDDQLVSRKLHTDVLQVVFARTANHDLVGHGARLPTRPRGR